VEGSKLDVGDLNVEPAYRITGRVVLSDGKSVPANTRMLFSREDAWDTQTVTVGQDGSFDASGIPHGIISITASAPGHRVSDKNKSLEPLNRFSLQGLVDKDIENLIILLEPGTKEMGQWPNSPLEQRALTRKLERLKVEPPVGVTADLQAPPEDDSPTFTVAKKSWQPLPKIELPPLEPALPAINADVPQRTIAGRVTDQDGKPIADAEVWMPVRWIAAANFLTAHAHCGNDGKFELRFPAVWVPDDITRIQPIVWAYSPGRSVATTSVFKQLKDEKSDEPCQIQLPPASDTKFTILRPDGQAVVGAHVEPEHFLTPRAYEYVPSGILALTTATTDVSGQVSLPAYLRKQLGELRVTSEEFGTQVFNLNIAPESESNPLKLLPVGRLEGRVLADQPELLRNLSISLETETDPAGELINCHGSALVSVHPDGTFVIPQIAAGWIELYASSDPRLPVKLRLPDRHEIEVILGKTTRLEIPFETAVHAHGVIRAKGTGEPVAGAIIFVGFGSGHQGDQVKSDAAGKYSSYVLPGNVRLQEIYVPQGLTQLSDSRMAQTNVPDDVADFELPPIELEKTKTVSGHLLDRNGQPLADHRVIGSVGNFNYGSGTSDKKGDFELNGVPENMQLDKYLVWDNDRSSPPMETTVVTADPLVLRIKQ
jgi:hypothetical protein